MELRLEDSVGKLPLVGPVQLRNLAKLEIRTIEDLLNHYPFRYQDFRPVKKISELLWGQTVTIAGKLIKIENIYTRNRKNLIKARLADETGEMELIWFNQPFISKTLKPGIDLNISGRVDEFSGKLAFISPDYEQRSRIWSAPAGQDPGSDNIHTARPIHTARLVPIYPETAGISSKWLRSRLNFLLNSLARLPEILPPDLVASEGLVGLPEALNKIHFPENTEEIAEAKKRLSFDELFFLQLGAKLNRQKWDGHKSIYHLSIVNCQLKINRFINSLPFELTADQQKVAAEILHDLAHSTPMNRLLQGDVGSGKTVVAAIAAYATALSGYKVLLMCPTEILAAQHYQTFKNLLSSNKIDISLVTSSSRQNFRNQKSPAKRDPPPFEGLRIPQGLERLEKKIENQIFIGTHALLYDLGNITDVGLIVIDEQHKFGVQQRTQLIEMFKNGNKIPHLLSLTATPIPRTLALTSLGDLDISHIEELPQGRRPIKTWVVPPEKRSAAYAWIKNKIRTGPEQAYIVCPFIEESETETLKSMRAAKKEVASLEKIFSPLTVELIHGKLKSKEKEAAMAKFSRGESKILVATPVVEVGVDNPQATIILIEGAERFGLASLHQLRGRVGRSNLASYCLLFTTDNTGKNQDRLKLLEKTSSGLKLAEFDLKNRGVGQIYGRDQSGFLKTKIADLTDLALISHINQLVGKFVETSDLSKFPLLLDKIKESTSTHPD